MRLAPRLTRLAPPLAIVLIAVLVLAFVETSLVYLRTLTGEMPSEFAGTFRRMLIPWGELGLLVPLVLLLAKRFPLTSQRLWRVVPVHILASFLIGAIHLFLDVVIAREVFGELRFSLLDMISGMFSRYMLQDVFLYWTFIGALQVFWNRRALRERELSRARLAAELAEARLATLEARLEPHFLFNTLNTAVMLVRGDERERAVEVLVELSELLRVVIQGAPTHQIPLADEWEFVRRYLALEQARFEDRLTVRLEREAGLDTVPVPFLILQPLVENALRHGIAKRTSAGPGIVEVLARRANGRLQLEVRDNGPRLDPSGTHPNRLPGIGLANVRARLQELYGERGELRVDAAPGGGTAAVVLLPLV